MLCGRIMKNRRMHIDRGENPDDLKSVFEDAGNSLSEAIFMIRRDLKKKGIVVGNINNIEDPPEPWHFPLYREVDKWRSMMEDILKEAAGNGELWIETEAAADVMWYKDTLAAKTYRELCNRWHIEQGDEYGDVDYEYTKYVIGECISILETSLNGLIQLTSPQKAELMVALGNLLKLKAEILRI